MRRRWFQKEDGTYYRNFNLIEQELELPFNRNFPWRWRSLMNEVREVNSSYSGTITTEKIGRRDEVVEPLSFRVAFPHDPRMWKFDED